MISAALALCLLTPDPADELGGVPASLWSRFKTGANVTRWFCYVPGNVTPDHYAGYLGDQDFAVFKRLRISFVRLCISPEVVLKDGRLNDAVMPHIDKALDRFNRAGIAVIFDLHDNGQLKLDQAGARTQEFQRFWRDIATRYKGKQEKQVVFELLNEPVFNDNPSAWYSLQKGTVDIIRKIDPQRTVMVTSTGWSGIDGFVKQQKLAAKNLIYTFHCYDPFHFSHQGATWAGEEVKHLKNMPFPSSPEAVNAMIDGIEDKYKSLVKWYGSERYDDAYLLGRIKKAADWGHANAVPVLLGEFGSYPPVAAPDSRARWFVAMRKAIDTTGVANCIWGYDDGFGLGRRREPDGSLWLDPVTLKNFFRVGEKGNQ